MSSGNESNTTNPTSTNNSPNVSSGNDDDMSPQNGKLVSSSASEGEDDEDDENETSTISKKNKKKFVSTPNSSKASDDDDEDVEGNVITDEKGNKVHQCPYCDSKFRIRGYLTRHVKKHNSEKAYKCPYYDHDSTQKCHATGGFSRRDTYKTHLKSRHFKYPPGIKSGDRIGMMGWCGICGEKFANNEIWVERHIERGLCSGLTEEYIKTLKIGKKKTGKHSRLLDVEDQPNMSNSKIGGGMVNIPSNGTNSPANTNITTNTEQPHQFT
ncbi:unnamed protein product [[Candida] boidinii]|uniref:Unnamed protein product n=1 Tax=Candida boidinii TaxID=5477 RepID=A0ACB5U3S8_CANBO|nr:unnamed protein product [[Candida] boidinii]